MSSVCPLSFTPYHCMLTCLAVEDRIFSINQPQAFFTMFGNMGGAASADLAIEGFEDDLKLTGRSVSQLSNLLGRQLIIRYSMSWRQ
jgi:syntaxin-binding protein 1